MRKHGIENFEFEVIEECDDFQVDEREKFWIAHYDSTNRDKGYNLSKGGQGHTKESRRKLSEALKGNTHCVGRKASLETRKKLKIETYIKLGRILASLEREFCVPYWTLKRIKHACCSQKEITMKKFQSPAYKLSKAMKNTLLAKAFVDSRREGVTINVCSIDNHTLRKGADGEKDDHRINVCVVKGLIKKAWVG